MTKVKLSVLDLIPRFAGENFKDAIEKSLQLAQKVEKIGYHRYWIAEHHNFPGVVSSSTAVLIGHFLEKTENIRIGAGGVMMPNHTALQVAETYGTLETMYPKRVDLGLGRAPGTDLDTAKLIYRGDYSSEGFNTAINDLKRYFGPEDAQNEVSAYPGIGLNIPMYLLGSSPASAYIAAELGLPYSFAGHFAPKHLEEAIEIYRNNFKASEQLSEPYFILGVLAYGAEDDEQGDFLFTSAQQAIINLSRGKKEVYQEPNRDFMESLSSVEKILLETRGGLYLKGGIENVKNQYKNLLEKYNPDEIIGVSYMKNLEDLVKSYEVIYKAIME